MKAYELVSNGGWVQWETAVDKNDQAVPWESREAVKWSIGGALMRCYPDGQKRKPIWDRVRQAVGEIGLAAWHMNPKRTEEDVVGLLKRCE